MHFECGHGVEDRKSMKRIDTAKLKDAGIVRTYECPDCGCRVKYFVKLKKVVVWCPKKRDDVFVEGKLEIEKIDGIILDRSNETPATLSKFFDPVEVAQIVRFFKDNEDAYKIVVRNL